VFFPSPSRQMPVYCEGVSKLVTNWDKTLNMWYSNLEKTFISRHILHQHWYACPIALPVHRNPQHRSLLAVSLSHFRTSVSTSSSLAKRLPPRRFVSGPNI
jgi:hypothetical protein